MEEVMKDILRIKQIMPIPNRYTLLTPIEDETGKQIMYDLAKDGWPQVLALVDGGDWHDDYVAAYQMDLTGIGDLADQFAMVEIRHCPECGKRMEIHMQPNDGASLEYHCSCGRHYQFRA
jgi:hypothetical protein